MNIVITGSTSGIGLETVKGILPIASNVILPVRDLEKAKKLTSKFQNRERIHLVEMDLSSMKSARRAAEYIAHKFPGIDVLLNNAGGIFQAGKKTSEGIDHSFAVNHLGHFVLSKTLVPNLIATQGKIVYVSSIAHRLAAVDRNDLGLLRSSSSMLTYGNVKLYNILISRYLYRQYKTEGLHSYSLHPGAVRTAFGDSSGPFMKAFIGASKLFFISPEKGAETSLFLAETSSSQLVNGAYYARKKPKTPSKNALDNELGELLWKYSEAVIAGIGS